MRILISPSTYIIPGNAESLRNWKVDKILVYGTDINANLTDIPYKEDDKDVTLFIPTIIDDVNALAYDGVSLALKILFKTICARHSGINIVLMGCETKESFLTHYPYPNIMKIPGFHYTFFNCGLVSHMQLLSCPIRQREEYKPYIENLGLKMPTSFKSTHSLTNEWSLYKWNSFMGFVQSTELDRLDYLYFDYLKAIEKLNNVKERKVKNNPELLKQIYTLKQKQKKVLLIEDKTQWHRFFEDFFRDSKIEFEAIGANYKKLTTEEVLAQIKEKVMDFDPDVILLDFRLIEDSDADEKFEKISGTRALKELKGSFDNPGIAFGSQIMIFSATSRIENILRLKEMNADGFIIKEKPENYKGKGVTKDVIRKMVTDLDNAFNRAEFLKPLNNQFERLSGLRQIKEARYIDLRTTVERVVQSIRALTQTNALDMDVLKIVYLNLFSIMESLKKDKLPLYSYIDTEASRLRLDSAPYLLWEDICEIRKCIAHGDLKIGKGKFKGREITVDLLKDEILNLIFFINEFLKLYLK